MEIIRENDFILIHFVDVKNDNKKYIARTEFTEQLWDIINSTIWAIKYTKDKSGNETPKYLSSGKLKKDLHHVIIDFYFGEEYRKQAYKKLRLVVEHLNNNGFDCRVSNLFFLHKIKNYYKGIYYDKLRDENRLILALHIHHIIHNKTFQITIGFNIDIKEQESNKSIACIKLLYEYDYNLVFQDAENLIENIWKSKVIDLNEIHNKYRYNDIKIQYFDIIHPTKDEEGLTPGCIIQRNGKLYLIMSDMDDVQYETLPDETTRPTGIAVFDYIHYEEKWYLK